MHVLYSNSRIFVIPVYIFNGRKQTLVDTSGYCQRCACMVCMTSASSWPNCVSRVARIRKCNFSHIPDLSFTNIWNYTIYAQSMSPLLDKFTLSVKAVSGDIHNQSCMKFWQDFLIYKDISLIQKYRMTKLQICPQ